MDGYTLKVLPIESRFSLHLIFNRITETVEIILTNVLPTSAIDDYLIKQVLTASQYLNTNDAYYFNIIDFSSYFR